MSRNWKSATIPVVDVFAGPGGLGEGFSALKWEEQNIFRLALSIEKDPIAHKTLLLRSFFRQFPAGAPDEYYSYISALDSRTHLERLEILKNNFKRQWQAANAEALCLELGKFPTVRLDEAISRKLGSAANWVLIGGPPCQAYSLVGRSRMSRDQANFEKDPRHFLYREYLGIIAAHLPPVFVMENVKGLLSSTIKGDLIVERILADLRKPRKSLPGRIHCSSAVSAEYDIFPVVNNGNEGELFEDIHVSDYLVQCERHGIPQARHRLIFLGIRRDLVAKGIVPGTLNLVERRYTVREAIEDLPKLRSKLSKERDSAELWRDAVAQSSQPSVLEDRRVPSLVRRRVKELARFVEIAFEPGREYVDYEARPVIQPDWFVDPRLAGVCNHSSRGHIRKDLWRYFYAACFADVTGSSPKLEDFPYSLWPKHKNARRDQKSGLVFEDRFRVQVGNRPSTTVTSHISKDGHYYIHPDPLQCRSLTVREAARLQTFPDNYFFEGPRTSQYQQVGNAVPPLIAKQIAAIVAELFTRR